MSQRTAFILICLAITINDFSNCCTDSELAHGCRVEKSDITASLECLCGVGCKKEFPYKSRTECEAALKSRPTRDTNLDPCLSRPCQNRGECIQLRFGRYRCECTGTNFYGDHCEKECPRRIGSNAFGFEDTGFPLECIEI